MPPENTTTDGIMDSVSLVRSLDHVLRKGLTCSVFTTEVMLPTSSDRSNKASSVGNTTPPMCALPPYQ